MLWGLLFSKVMFWCGELTAIETICHLIVTSELEECFITIPNPFDEDSSIDLYITLDKATENDVRIVNGAPYIKTNVKVNSRILSAHKNSNYFDENNLELLESYANSYLKSELENYFYKTSKEYKSDIASLGKHAVKYFSTWDEWVNYDWLNSYQNAFFDVNVDVEVTSSYLIS